MHVYFKSEIFEKWRIFFFFFFFGNEHYFESENYFRIISTRDTYLQKKKKKKNLEIILRYKSKFESKVIEKVFFTKRIALKMKISNNHSRIFHLQKVLSKEQLLKVLFSNILTSFPQKRKKKKGKKTNRTQR